MGVMGTADIIVLVFATMVSKLLFLAWVIHWLRRKAVLDEAWEYENAWDDGWSQRPPEADWDNLLLQVQRDQAERRGSDQAR